MPSYEELGSINSEIRYITVELMKISTKRKMPFDKVAQEFLSNAITLHDMIQRVETVQKGRKKD